VNEGERRESLEGKKPFKGSETQTQMGHTNASTRKEPLNSLTHCHITADKGGKGADIGGGDLRGPTSMRIDECGEVGVDR